MTPREVAEHEARIAAQMRAGEPFGRSKPSEVSEVFWIYAARKEGSYPSPTPRSGKWLVFGDAARVDEVWDEIREATERGALGGFSKVATSRPNPTGPDPSRRVICVYTYDSDDVQDVMRVRDSLRNLGVTEKTGYKTDAKTVAGVYVARGFSQEEVWKYHE